MPGARVERHGTVTTRPVEFDDWMMYHVLVAG